MEDEYAMCRFGVGNGRPDPRFGSGPWVPVPVPDPGFPEKAKATKAELEPCFAAGTLVHTINGLVPIEQIKVGDLVLSKPEDGGEQSYKPVTKTFEHDFKEVIALEVDFSAEPRDIYDLTAKPSGGTLQDSNGNRFKYIVADENNPTGGTKSEWIISTWNHPFFVKKQFEKIGYDHPNGVKPEWVKLCQMGYGDEIEAFNGKTARICVVKDLYRTYEYDPNFAVANYSERHDWDDGYYLIDLHARPLMGKLVDYSPQFGGSMPQVQITVYNFEVQDNHTYYVGEIGLWVHNKNTRLKVLDADQAKLLIKGENPGDVFYIKENRKTGTAGVTPERYEREARGALVLDDELVAKFEFQGPNSRVRSQYCSVSNSRVTIPGSGLPFPKVSNSRVRSPISQG